MRTRPSQRAGFTLIELAIVVFIVGLIVAVATPRMTKTLADRNARNARDAFAWNANRARARAIQTGNTFLYVVNPSNERAWIYKRNPTTGDTLAVVDFLSEFDARVSTNSNNTFTLCYGPRGYAYDCTGAGTNTFEVTFTTGGYSATARVKPLGQVDRL